MFNAKFKKPLRHIVLVGMILLFPLLYIGGVTIGDSSTAAVALGAGSIIALLAILSY